MLAKIRDELKTGEWDQFYIIKIARVESNTDRSESEDVLMRICTDKEAFDLGFDPAVTRVVGDSNYMEIKSTLAYNEHTLGYPISVDGRIQTLDARLTIPPALYALKFESKTPDDRRVKARFLDVIGINPFTPDGGILLGFEYIVSESARDKLAPYLKDECSFIPLAVAGVPQPYYIIWVHQIEDALDEERSRLGDDDFCRARNVHFVLYSIWIRSKLLIYSVCHSGSTRWIAISP